MAFESLTDGRILELLVMNKSAINPAARMVDDGNHQRRDIVLESADGQERFRLYVRQNKTIEEDFSYGLVWLPAGGETLTLVRYNGASHRHPNRLENTVVEFACHIHRATERYIQANLKPESFAEAATGYITSAGALHQLVSDCNILGLETKPDHPELF